MSHGAGFSSSGAFASMGVDNALDLAAFRASFAVEVQAHRRERNSEGEEAESTLVLDMRGADVALANGLRRTLLADVPTMAVERVFVRNNTSLVQDEVLAHRLGMLPIRADARAFAFPAAYDVETRALDEAPAADPAEALLFRLQAACEAGAGGGSQVVYSRQLQWVPLQGQEGMQPPPRVVHPDIPVAKLAQGQAIDVEVHVLKGTGATHAKWSPVATASYRLLPDVSFASRVLGPDATHLVQACPMDVFDVEDVAGTQVARVVAPRECTMCRECVRSPGWEDRILLDRVRDHFIFTIESTGALDAADLFREAVRIMAAKCDALDACLAPEAEAGGR